MKYIPHTLLSFVAIVKAGSFSKAAKNIGISKAQLSRHLDQLEKTLGIQLLYRTTRSLSLTESGEEFFQSCLALEENYFEAIENIKHNFYAVEGTLRITSPISIGMEFFPKIIHQFAQEYPNVKIILSLTSVTEDLIEKNYDLAIRVANTLPDSNLRVRTLMELDMVLCASKDYLKAQKPLLQLEDLKTHPCITSVNRNLQIQKIQWPFMINDKIVKYAPNSVVELDSLHAQIELVKLGLGIGRVPKIFIKDELKKGNLLQVLPQLSQPKSYVYLLYPNRKSLPKKIQLFLEFIKEMFPDMVS